jgi:tRNA-dihydrouridine synthase
MDGVSDHPFRHIQKKYGNPQVIYTEFTSVDALCFGDWLSLYNLFYDESQRPIIAQIYGKTPAYFRQVAILLCELGFDGIDLNMGCPAKNVAQKGCGAGLIRTPPLAQSLICAVQSGVQAWQNGATYADCPDLPARFAPWVANRRQSLPPIYQQRRPIPVSVKTRIGYESPAISEWLPWLLETELAAVTLHGRTLKQAYAGQADWSEIGRGAQLARGSGAFILGNGDVISYADAQQRTACYGLDGVLIGRASFGNPFVFQPTDDLLDNDTRRRLLIEIALEHAQLYHQTFSPHPRYWFAPMRKHLGWYVKEIPHARQLRARLMQVKSPGEVEAILGVEGLKG